MLLPWSMLPDVIDADDLRTGLRREGFVYSVFVVVDLVSMHVCLHAVMAAASYTLSLWLNA